MSTPADILLPCAQTSECKHSDMRSRKSTDINLNSDAVSKHAQHKGPDTTKWM